MQISSSNPQVHKYLEDEYNRLNREVEKVNEEIVCLEELERSDEGRGKKVAEKRQQIYDEEEEEIDV